MVVNRVAHGLYLLGDLAQVAGAQLRGDAGYQISAVAPLNTASSADLTFYQDPHLRSLLKASRAGAVVITPQDAEDFVGNCLLTDNPYAAFARIMQHIYPQDTLQPGLHHTAQLARDAQVDPGARIDAYVQIESGAVIAAGVWLEAGTFIGAGVAVGRGSHLYPGVKIYAGCKLGADCILHAGAVIGADGFGFAEADGRFLKIPQVGRVLIGNGVEIGANSCVDRGALADTVIEDGVKIDNLVQIGHNVQIGAHTVIAGQTGIAGSTRVGRHCRIGGQVGITGHIEIADGCVIAGQSAVTHSLHRPGVYSGVIPAQEVNRWRRIVARLNGLDALFRRVQRIEREAGQDLSTNGEPSDRE